jgi:hypothetical protein
LILQSYSFYLGVFYLLVGLILGSVALCIWVGWCFSNNSFPFLWPIHVLRVVVSVFIMIFYIPSLNMFLMSFQCKLDHGVRRWPAPPPPQCLPARLPGLAGGSVDARSTCSMRAAGPGQGRVGR